MVAHPRLGEVPQVKAMTAALPPHWAQTELALKVFDVI